MRRPGLIAAAAGACAGRQQSRRSFGPFAGPFSGRSRRVRLAEPITRDWRRSLKPKVASSNLVGRIPRMPPYMAESGPVGGIFLGQVCILQRVNRGGGGREAGVRRALAANTVMGLSTAKRID